MSGSSNTLAGTALQAVVCLDGSQRAAEALVAAHAFAERRGEDIEVVAIDQGDVQVRLRLEQQLASVGLDPSAISTVASRSEMVDAIRLASERGSTPVISAFGRWDTTGRLFGVLGELIRFDVPRVLAVGPFAQECHFAAQGTVIVSTDGVHDAEPLVRAARPFVAADSARIVLARVVRPDHAGMPYATHRDASKFRESLDVQVEAVALVGSNVSRAIADAARRERAELVIARSWHRWHPQPLGSASTSLSIAADAPCPVLIVN